MNLQAIEAIAVSTSAFIGLLTINIVRRNGIGRDSASKVQGIHPHEVPRLGGVPVFLGFLMAVLAAATADDFISVRTVFLIVLTLFPTFLAGLYEDLCGGRLGAWRRLLITVISAGLGYVLLGAHIPRLDIAGVDFVLARWKIFALMLTLLAGAGIPHAINIIDGCNGLAGFVSMIALIGIGVAGFEASDSLVSTLSFSGAGALAGFLIWNFPFGRLFLGDSGAYFSGFLIAELSMLLVARHPDLSPWFPFVLVAYPVWETVYSSFRRAIRDPRSVMSPDANHLHQLIYRWILENFQGGRSSRGLVLSNSASALAFWVWSVAALILSLEFRSNSAVLKLLAIAFVAGYIVVYARLRQSKRFKSRPAAEFELSQNSQMADGHRVH